MVSDRRFDPAIPLSGGKSLQTIGEAVTYMDRLLRAEQLTKEWQAAMDALKTGHRPRRADHVRAHGDHERHQSQCSATALNRGKLDRPWKAQGRARTQR